jgi:hypothetical protein
MSLTFVAIDLKYTPCRKGRDCPSPLCGFQHAWVQRDHPLVPHLTSAAANNTETLPPPGSYEINGTTYFLIPAHSVSTLLSHLGNTDARQTSAQSAPWYPPDGAAPVSGANPHGISYDAWPLYRPSQTVSPNGTRLSQTTANADLGSQLQREIEIRSIANRRQPGHAYQDSSHIAATGTAPIFYTIS